MVEQVDRSWVGGKVIEKLYDFGDVIARCWDERDLPASRRTFAPECTGGAGDDGIEGILFVQPTKNLLEDGYQLRRGLLADGKLLLGQQA